MDAEKLNKINSMEMKSLAKYIVVVAIAFFVICAASVAYSDQSTLFPKDKIRINYTTGENTEMVLRAVRKAYDFFSTIGNSETYSLEIIFQKAVMVKTSNGGLIRVYGKLGKDNRIYLTDWDVPWLAEQNAYGLRMFRPLYESLIVHEVAHFIAEKIADRKIENTLSEYIAYVVQFSQMQPRIRQAILNQKTLSAFKTEEINLEIMLLDPAAFAAKSYLHFKENKGQYFREILSGSSRQCSNVAYWHFH